MLAVVGKPERLMAISEPATATAAVTELLPPVPVPPFTSFAAPVATETVVVPVAVGVPLTAHEMLAPTATVAGVAGVQVPTVTPGGSPAIEHVADTALAVALALFVHLTVPE